MPAGELTVAFSAGLVATGSPCVLPLYPGYLAYISSQSQSADHPKSRYVLGLFVLLGVLSVMVAIGAALALMQVAVADAMSVAIPVAYGAIIVLGGLLLLDVNPFARMAEIKTPVISSPVANVYVYGLLYGPVAFPCSGPLLVSIFALSFTATQFLETFVLFLVFGLGLGVPLLGLSLLAGTYQRRLVKLVATHSRWVNAFAGVLLVGVGAYGTRSNWDFLLLYFG